MNATFTQAGVSRLKGEFKARFANDALRVKVLAKNGHTDIDLMELPTPMTKEAAVAFLIDINFDNGNAEVRAALDAELDKRTEKPKAEKAPKEPKVKKEKKAEVSMESIKEKIAEAAEAAATVEDASATVEDIKLEDAPF
jgi:outer membrane biosynthesis protein TonB